MRAEAGALDPAEGHVHVDPGGLPVHPNDAGFDRLRELPCRGEARREDRSRKPELDGIRTSQRVLQVRESVERGDRAEDLLAGEEGVVGDALEERRLEQVGLVVVGAPAAGEHRSALRLSALDPGEHLLELLLVDDRADLGRRVVRIADDTALHPGQQPAAEVVVDRLLHINPASRGAFLSGRPERAGVGQLDGAVEVRVGHHDHRVVAAELELDALAERGRLVADLPSDRH